MKNVLFITYDFPYPATSGGKNRAYHMLKYGGAHNKYLMSFVREGFDREYIKEMENIGVEVVATIKRKKTRDPNNIKNVLLGASIFRSLYYSNEVLDQILNVISIKKIDVIHFESYYTAFFISEKIAELGVKQVFGTENIEYKVYRDYALGKNLLVSKMLEPHIKRIKREEEEFYKKADMNVAVSEHDANFIRKFANCEVVKNGVDTTNFEFKLPKNEHGTKLLYVGNFTYFPNTDAINYFYDNVFTKLDMRFNLEIIGKGSSKLNINDSRVKKTEFIEDIADAYHAADIMVSPLRLGGGTNFKILEAMAAGLPIVALPDRLSGLEVSNNKNIIVVESASEFAEKIDSLAGDLEERKKIAKNGREFIEENYSWEKIGKKLESVWENL